jgi:hypothetical protein
MQAGRRLVELSKAKINSLEHKLSGTFRPVAPRREFVRGLGHRIQKGSPATIVDRLASLKVFLLVIAGRVSFGVLILVGMRALASLFSRKTPSRA